MKRELPTAFLQHLAVVKEQDILKKQLQLIENNKSTSTTKKKKSRTTTNKFKAFITRIKFFVKTLWSKYVTKPRAIKKEVKRKEIERKRVIKSFEQTYGVSHAEVTALMSGKFTEQTNDDYLNEKLAEVRKKMQYVHNRTPNFYEPEICDIHNENPDRSEYPSLKEVLRNEDKIVSEEFSDINSKKNKSRGNFVWLTRG